MKKIRCPRCDNYILFDESKYEDKQLILLECTSCRRRYNIRIGAKQSDEGRIYDSQTDHRLGKVVVLENGYGYRQEFFLAPGSNSVGRRSKGSGVQIAIDSDDITLARNHAVIEVKQYPNGRVSYSISDLGNQYGTFLNGKEVKQNECVALQSNDTIVIGSTTLILYLDDTAQEE